MKRERRPALARQNEIPTGCGTLRMLLLIFPAAFLAWAGITSGTVHAGGAHDATKRIRIVLAGDSTVTAQAGWGSGFAELLSEDAECLNLARGGRSSRSYRAEGWWKECLELKPDYLLIQFGHNDQPGKGPERESAADGAFREHLRRYVDEAREAECQPVLITSLTRRRWNDQRQIDSSLAAYAEATKLVASEMNVPLVDLHQLSMDQCNAMGPTAFRAFEPMSVKGADHTHLNAEGSRAVGRLVMRALIKVVPALSRVVVRDRLLEPRVTSLARVVDPRGNFTLTDTPATIAIARGNSTILVYNKQSPPVPDGIDATYQRSGFLHPVATPQGKVVTATFPFDHPHQHGIFSAWVKTRFDDRAMDFWNLAGGTGRVLHQRVISTFSNEAATGFEVDLIHQTEQSPVVDVLRERWRVSVLPTDGSYYCFDLTSRQEALTEKPLVIEQYHYGGMAVRGPVRWLQEQDRENRQHLDNPREPSEFLNHLGSDRLRGNHEHAKWVSLSGLIDGASATISVLCHADNFRSPQAARIHPTKPYFCFAPCVDGDFQIDREHPLVARYRFLVTDAAPDAGWLDRQWTAWCAP